MSVAIYAQKNSDTTHLSGKVSRLSLFTGTGTPLRFLNVFEETRLNVPVLLTFEKNRVFDVLPDFVFVGGYVRYANFTTIDEDILGKETNRFNWSMFGVGTRWKVDIMEAINSHKRRMNKPEVGKWVNFYGGCQIGMDFLIVPENETVIISSSNSAETKRDFRFDLFLGVGIYANEKLSFQFELGRTSPATFTIGASYKLTSKNSASL